MINFIEPPMRNVIINTIMLHGTPCSYIFRRRPRFRFTPSCYPDIPQSRRYQSVLSEPLILQITHSTDLLQSDSMLWIIETSYWSRGKCALP
ncbi:hypothetical protein CDAR_607281 [Caerostris darwini]|uniref:Uncharacterized protein n=1 Tax=Caerostris darwini TaxID=1538125 RepID=A0AAV4NL83_9ARAC|nr:hypothetical protein CDAR_607281 [Caerostris darwini]